MNTAEWILVIMLAISLLMFLILAIILVIKLIYLADDAKKIIATGQGIAAKADDIVDNVKGMTSVGGIVKTFANRVMENQERRYAEQDAARDARAAEAAAEAQAAEEAVEKANRRAQAAAKKAAKKTAKK